MCRTVFSRVRAGFAVCVALGFSELMFSKMETIFHAASVLKPVMISAGRMSSCHKLGNINERTGLGFATALFTVALVD